MKLARAAISSSLLLLGGILAHHLAGGDVAATQNLTTFFLLNVLLALLLTQEETSEGRIIFSVFVAQNSAHFLLGGAIHEPISMYVAHTVAGVATFLAISKASKILIYLTDLIRMLAEVIVLPPRFSKASIASTRTWSCTPYLQSFKELAHSRSYSLRAPPSK